MNKKAGNDSELEETKVMMFNFTDKYKVTTKLNSNNKNLEVVKQTKHLGAILTELCKIV